MKMPFALPLKLRLPLLALCCGLLFANCSPQAKTARHVSRGESYLKAGDYESAKIEFLKALRTDANNLSAVQNLGLIWSEQGAPVRALPYLFKIRELAPAQVESRLRLAEMLRSIGLYGDARKEALAVLATAPSNADALLLLAETITSRESLEETQQQIDKFPARNDGLYQLAVANVALRKGDAAAMESALGEAVKASPQSPVVHLALANAAASHQDTTRSEEEFKKALALAPARSPIHLNYAEFKARSGAMPEAKAHLQEIIRQTPDYLPASVMLARLAFGEKKYDEALATIDSLLQRDALNIDALMLQSEIWLAKGEVDKAVQGLQRVGADFPKMPGARYQLARALLAKGDTTSAVKALKEAVALNPESADPINLLAEIDAREGRAQAAVNALEPLLQKHPELAQSRLLLAAAYRAVGRLDDAAALFRQQIEKAPREPQGYFMLGMILRQQNKTAEAQKAFTQAQELAPNDLTITFQLVELDVLANDFASALQKVQTQIERQPKSAGALFLQGKIYATQKEWAKAEESLHKALELDPSSPSASDLLIGIYVATNRLGEALKREEEIASAHPADAKALQSLGVMYEKSGQIPKAVEAYEKLLAVNPESVVALNNLAAIYAGQSGKTDKAVEMAKKAHTLRSADPDISDTYGWLLYQKGDYQQALTLLQESSTGRQTKSAEGEFHLGMALAGMGQYDAARTHLHNAASAAEDFPHKSDISPRLALLEDSSGKPRQATAEELEAASKNQSGDVMIWLLLGEAYLRNGAAKQAIDAFNQALKLNPKLAAATARLAQLNADALHNTDEALRLAKKARELAPADPHVAALAGHAALLAGNTSWACELLQEARGAAPNDPSISRDLALATYCVGRIADARKVMQDIATAAGSGTPESRDAQAFLALTSYTGDPKALSTLEPRAEQTLKTNPTDIPALLIRAAAQNQRGDKTKAETTYAEILTPFPDCEPAQKALALFYADDPNKRGPAYDLAIKARKAQPDDPEIAQLLAELSYHRNEFDYAAQLLKGSADKKPLSARYLYYLGMAQFKTNNKPQSLEALRQSLTSGLQEPLAADAKRVVAELEAKK